VIRKIKRQNFEKSEQRLFSPVKLEKTFFKSNSNTNYGGQINNIDEVSESEEDEEYEFSYDTDFD